MDQLLLRLDRLRHYRFLQIFTIYLRYLIGGGFVIAAIGMGKFSDEELLISQPGVPIESLSPIGQFFRVMATSGLYWNFIGWSQILTGILLITQRYSKAGALVFLGMILNIFVITVSYHFQGTPVVTGLMLLAAIYLLMWDADSFQTIFRDPGRVGKHYPQPLLIKRPLWTITGCVMVVVVIALAMLKVNVLIQFAAAFGVGFGAFLIYIFPFKQGQPLQSD